MKNTAILLITCPDRKGIVAGGRASSCTGTTPTSCTPTSTRTPSASLFLMRVEWDLTGFTLDLAEFPRRFAPLADRFEMRWRLERLRPAAPASPCSSRSTTTA